jgi:hypothetical protein
MTEEQKKIYELVKSLYKNEDGTPVLLSPTQCDIFATIAMKKHPRNHCMTFTRFGKSRTTALAVLTRCATFPEKWAIVSGSKDKAKIIMNYINGHIFDSEYVASKFRMDKGDSADAIRRHRNKNHITFDLGGGKISEIFITSAKDAIGHGASNVVEDEASLIPNDEHALVMRMLGDNPDDSFLFKIGNPFLRNHFLDSYNDPSYNKILINAEQGVHEGRISRSLIDEMRKFSFFGVLYDVKFPSAESVDSEGWSYILTEDDIKTATERKQEPFGFLRMGVDIARGGRNFNAWVIRGDNWAKVLRKDLDNDLMSVAGKTIAFIKEYKINPENVSIDDVGVGGGVTDRLREQGFNVNAVVEGSKDYKDNELPRLEADAKRRGYALERFSNFKARLYAGKDGVANWIKRTGYLEPHEDWAELLKIRYKKDSNGRTRIESKDDMRARGEESPDVADALMLTFSTQVVQANNFTMPDPMVILSGKNRWDL